MTDKSLCNFSVILSGAITHLRDQRDLIHDEKINIMSVCLFSCLSYPAWPSHLFCTILYCHLWPVQLYHIFPHYLIYGTIFTKNFLNTKCVFWFSLHHMPGTFLILRRMSWDITQIHIGLHVKYMLFLHLLMKLEFWQNFENPFTGSQTVPSDRRMD